jgi:hypothetical protein
MKNRLWFVTNGVSLVNVHLSEKDAQAEYDSYAAEEDFEFYDVYSLLIDDLDDYPDEMDLAIEYGYL